ncbi:MAG: YceI family protein [Actinomycetota bacterium]|nr:MAG: YceI family protein [Actinomycetota bacterium]
MAAPTKASELSIEPGVWNIDHAHSAIEFTARHLVVTKVRGSFSSFTASIDVAEDITQSKISAEIDVASVSTGENDRDAHLKSADFFDVEKFPKITFVSTSIAPKGDHYALTGDLTIHGTTRSITLDLEFNGVTKDPWGNIKSGYTATGELSRKDFGMEWNAPLEGTGVLVSDKIQLSLEIQLAKA